MIPMSKVVYMSSGPKPQLGLIAILLQRSTTLIISGALEKTREELVDK